MGVTFPQICRFWVIVEDVMLRLGNLDGSPELRVPVSVVEYSYERLLQWAHELPEACVLKDNSPHHVMIMQYVHTSPPSSLNKVDSLLTQAEASGFTLPLSPFYVPGCVRLTLCVISLLTTVALVLFTKHPSNN